MKDAFDTDDAFVYGCLANASTGDLTNNTNLLNIKYSTRTLAPDKRNEQDEKVHVVPSE